MKRAELAFTAALVVAGAAAALVFLTKRGAYDPAGVPTAPSAPSASGAAKPAATSEPDRVVGTVTGRGIPLVGVRVVLAGTHAGQPSLLATTTSLAGTYDLPLSRGAFDPGTPLELRVQADGFEPLRKPVAAGTADAVLTPLAREPVPGRLRCTATGADGSPLRGDVVVCGFDEFLAPLRRAAVADGNGRFTLDGVPPGRWSLSLGDDQPRRDADVPADGTIDVKLVRAVDPPIPVRRTPGEFAEEEQAILRRVEAAAQRAAAPDATAETLSSCNEELERVQRELTELRRQRAATAPHRTLVVTGIPLTERAWVSVDADEGVWIFEATVGAARIPSVPLGATVVTIRRLDRTPVRVEVTVEKGFEPQVVEVTEALVAR